ncbi:hypothetical protein F1C10_11420 [Sphingomonas sp. NBWT7]|uniref:hypothetical protein n=1 Tax=Sphingomonas sp. NBWT7 TaxID=2596913 RepID=UPI0016293879|nr:hypothetical protein [Sphingomonas sp. NBWT7]QNE32494.1 hypothetical protein F1C10_11420 [Sphingomonas sp. NBWT7]
MVKLDAGRALIAYSGALTGAVIWLGLTAAAPSEKNARFDTIDVGRINVREPDGTLRMTIASSARAPGFIGGGKEYPRPDRRMAGLLFFNEEGTENGGLIFAGKDQGGKASSGGSLTFDRYNQDQVVQLFGFEEGQNRSAGIKVNDQPEERLDFLAVDRVRTLPENQQEAAYRAANVGGTQRLFAGRATDKSSQVVLRDGQGRKRLVLRVGEDGAASIDFLDPSGKVQRTVRPAAD